jgi:ISXO2-like transposase domain
MFCFIIIPYFYNYFYIKFLFEMGFPSLIDLKNIFFNESEAIQFLFDNRLLYKQPLCGKCRKNTYNYQKLWKCSNKNCNWCISIYRDTIFSNSNLKPNIILFLVYLWLSKCSNHSIITMTNLSSSTISCFINQFRDLITFNVKENHQKIGGEGIVVEIDESKFGKRKYNKGHLVEGVWVVGGVERTSERLFFAEPVKDRTSKTLIDVIKRNVKPDTIIYSDMWKGYTSIPDLLKLEHQTVNHSVNFVNPNTGTHTNTIEGTWNGLKLNISKRNYNIDRIEGHLFEFIWRRQNNNDLWSGVLNILKETIVL